VAQTFLRLKNPRKSRNQPRWCNDSASWQCNAVRKTWHPAHSSASNAYFEKDLYRTAKWKLDDFMTAVFSYSGEI
jgi:hypothetical protein